ncbi:hypothetical protein BH20ACT2_BH20ACT2_19720 [soil metagenome]
MSEMSCMNVVVLQGALCREPEERVLPSGDRLVAYEVRVQAVGRAAETVPVAWLDAPSRAAELAAGEAVVVTGRVRRRFFRAGGVTQSRTEVVADAVIPARRRATVRKAVAAALDAIRSAGG